MFLTLQIDGSFFPLFFFKANKKFIVLARWNGDQVILDSLFSATNLSLFNDAFSYRYSVFQWVWMHPHL